MNGITFAHPVRRLLRLQAVEAKAGIKKSQIYADPTFPKPIKLSKRASAWIEEEIDQWIAARIVDSRKSA